MAYVLQTAGRFFLMGALACLGLRGQPPQGGSFHADVSLVHIDAEVTDSNHRVLTGMQKDDFLVLDNDRPQAILSMTSEEQPVDLILLVDTSLSMRGVIQRISQGAEQAFKELRPGDRVGVMVFSSHSTVLLPLTKDLLTAQHIVEGALIPQGFWGGTAIQNAVADAAEQLKPENRTERRRAILIVTDNSGTRTRREDSVVHELWAADASLNGLIISDAKFTAERNVTTILAPETMLLRAGMKGIAEKTGGDVLRSTPDDTEFQEMMHRIRSRISLYYRMPEAKRGESRHVKVELSSTAQKRFPDAVVRARRGYIVP